MAFSEVNDPRLKTWLHVPTGSDFPIQNIPFGIYSNGGGIRIPATRIGNTVIDLSIMTDFGYFDDLGIEDLSVFYQPTLNPFIALGKPLTSKVRNRISELFRDGNRVIQDHREIRELLLHPAEKMEMHLPLDIGDYTDFYSSEYHAYNVGVMFRDPENALLPNWKHIPIGYHGRASSIVVSGTRIHRPKGQTKNKDKTAPDFGPSKQMDFELEVGFVVGSDTLLGTSINTSEAENYIFGLVLFNDLSARDIQTWEYVPLGPFLSKSFGSVISPWIVTLDALEPFRTRGPEQVPEVLPYLRFEGEKNYDINLEVSILPAYPRSSGVHEEMVVTRSNYRYLYWNMCQQLAHQTVNGCNIRIGDIYASGTISGPDPGSYGSMLEITWRGTRPVQMPDGTSRRFLHDNDTVIIRGWGEKNGVRIGFGECRTKILPAIK